MNDTLNKFIGSIKALDCWYVSCGATGSTFQLALGGKIPRTDILQNPDHTDEYRRFEGEANLLVWCVWRLDASDGPLTSWDDTKQGIEQGLAKLVGTRVESIDLLV